MEASYTPQDLLELAIGIEESGRRVYEHFEGAAKDEGLKGVWRLLKDQEADHRRTFERLRRDAGPGLKAEDSSAQATPYLRAIASSALFSEARLARMVLEGIDSDLDALQVAIAVEKDSVFFYITIKDHLIGDQGRVLEEIIAEEKLHLVRLVELRDKLAGGPAPEPAPDLPTGL